MSCLLSGAPLEGSLSSSIKLNFQLMAVCDYASWDSGREASGPHLHEYNNSLTMYCLSWHYCTVIVVCMYASIIHTHSTDNLWWGSSPQPRHCSYAMTTSTVSPTQSSMTVTLSSCGTVIIHFIQLSEGLISGIFNRMTGQVPVSINGVLIIHFVCNFIAFDISSHLSINKYDCTCPFFICMCLFVCLFICLHVCFEGLRSGFNFKNAPVLQLSRDSFSMTVSDALSVIFLPF